MALRVLVCGGRDYDNATVVETTLNDIHSEYSITTIIQGEAKGADHLGKLWAIGRGIETIDCPAQWDLYGKSAGYILNIYMLPMHPDLVVAFLGGRGTKMVVNISRKAGVEVIKVGNS